jgi:membrane protease YdiL (CAAX protease family)
VSEPARTSGPLWPLFGAHGLRSGWRALAFFGLFIAWTTLGGLAAAGLDAGLRALGLAVDPGLHLLLMMSVVYAPAFLLTALLGLLDRGGLRSVGLGGPGWRSVADALGGFAVGGLLVGLALILSLPWADLSLAPTSPSWAWALVPLWLLGLTVAAGWEEIAFRGYGFQWLCRATGHLLALGLRPLIPLDPDRVAQLLARAGWVLLSSLVFAALHMSNPAASWIGTANTALAGVWLALAVFRTRALWLAWGLHLGWNFTQGPILGLPISGLGSDESGITVPSLLSTSLTGPAWATGGGYGIESSVACTAALLVGVALSATWPERRKQAAAAVLAPGALPAP